MRLLVPLFVILLTSAALGGCVDTDEPANQPLSDEDGQPLGKDLRLVKVANGLENPIYLTTPGDGRLYVLEQVGRIQVVEGHRTEDGWQMGSLRDAPFLDISDQVQSGGEQGLLGLAFHPDWPDDPRAFVDYTDQAGDSVLSSFRLSDDGETLDRDSEVVLLTVDQPFSNHNGGMIAFGPDGMLYWGLGDGGGAGDPNRNGQAPTTLLGSMLRLDVSDENEYSIPPDNPFVESGEGRAEVWLYGLRNPWRFSFEGETLWIGDVGQNRFEEIDRVPRNVQAGANLGWSAYEGREAFDQTLAADLDRDDVVMPVATYRLSGDHCAVTGGYVYDGAVEKLRGKYVFADYCSGWVWALEEDEEAEGGYRMGLLFESDRQVPSFGVDEEGALYLVDHTGSILVLT